MTSPLTPIIPLAQMGHVEKIADALQNQPGMQQALLQELAKEALKEESKEIAVQVNGKLKAKITIPVDLGKDEVIAMAKKELGDKLTGIIIKEIYVPGKIVNIVAK